MRAAIIPARGGSKRIPRKNIHPFCGRPMIAWPIETAKNAGCFDRIVVSTDDEEIAQVAQDAGADVPFRRPAHLADDHATTRDAVVHAIDWLSKNDHAPSAVACIYPTAVLLNIEDIRLGQRYLIEDEVAYAITVTPFEFPIQRAVRLTSAKRMEMLQPEYRETRSQDLEKMYHDAGALYWSDPDAFQRGVPVFGPRTRPIVLPRERAVDIDTPADLRIAEAQFKSSRERIGM